MFGAAAATRLPQSNLTQERKSSIAAAAYVFKRPTGLSLDLLILQRRTPTHTHKPADLPHLIRSLELVQTVFLALFAAHFSHCAPNSKYRI